MILSVQRQVHDAIATAIRQHFGIAELTDLVDWNHPRPQYRIAAGENRCTTREMDRSHQSSAILS